MSGDFTLNAKARSEAGKGASRRLRRLENYIPAIVYGAGKDPQNISLPHDELLHSLEEEAFYTSILNLNIDGKTEPVVLKDLQRHPAKQKLIHADFMRIDQNTPITLAVPLHFLNEDTCKGVKLQGGTVTHTATELEIRCLPKDLPEYIEVDMQDCELGDHIHISDLKLPEGVESVQLMHGEDHDLPIAQISAPRGGASDDEEAAEGGEEGEAEGEG